MYAPVLLVESRLALQQLGQTVMYTVKISVFHVVLGMVYRKIMYVNFVIPLLVNIIKTQRALFSQQMVVFVQKVIVMWGGGSRSQALQKIIVQIVH